MDDLSKRLDSETPELDELRRINVNLQRQLAQAKAKTDALVEAVERAAYEAAVTIGRPKVANVKPSKKRKNAEVALIHATDWQCGKKTETYDSDVLEKRMELFASKIASITENQRADHPVDECVLMFGGDQVEGVSIFPGQPFEIDQTLYHQLFKAARIGEQLIVNLLETFSKIHVVAEWGNHGRLGRRGDMPSHDNMDLIMYGMLAERTKSDRVTWQYSTDWHQIVEIGNYRALLVHGDEIKSFGGNTPAFGILRKANAWATGVVDPFHDVYMGHFHTPMTLTMSNGGQIYVSGSPESDNQYAAEFVAARGRPSQRLHFVEPQAAIVTASYLVWLDDEQQ